MKFINRSYIRDYLILSLFNLNDTLEKIDYNIKKQNYPDSVNLKLKRLYNFLKDFEKENENNRRERVKCDPDTFNAFNTSNKSYFRMIITGSGPICNGEYWGTYYSWGYNKKGLKKLLKLYNNFLQDDMFIGFCNTITEKTIKEKEKKE